MHRWKNYENSSVALIFSISLGSSDRTASARRKCFCTPAAQMSSWNYSGVNCLTLLYCGKVFKEDFKYKIKYFYISTSVTRNKILHYHFLKNHGIWIAENACMPKYVVVSHLTMFISCNLIRNVPKIVYIFMIMICRALFRFGICEMFHSWKEHKIKDKFLWFSNIQNFPAAGTH